MIKNKKETESSIKQSISNINHNKELEIAKKAERIYQDYDESIENALEIAKNILL